MNIPIKLSQVFLGLVIGAWVLAPPLSSAAETSKLTPLRLAYSAISVNQAIP